MKIFDARTFSFFVVVGTAQLVIAQDEGQSLAIKGKHLTLDVPVECPQLLPSRKDLAKFLSQYDPRNDPRSDIRDETPWSEDEMNGIRTDLVRDGFHYPNGSESVITWMDFDDDGHCDFTASAGIGGMRSIDRMFLFRGLPDGQFQMVHSHISYMDTTIALVPYIPLKVAGERLPVLVMPKDSEMLQWQSSRQQLASCNVHSTQHPGRTASTLELLCPHMHKIANWANNQLPKANEAFNWGREPE